MHELSIAQGIMEIVEQYLPPGEAPTVKSVKVKVGELSGVVADSLEFCFQAISAGSRLQGAVLDIEQVPITADCSACRNHFRVLDSSFFCPVCGSGDIAIVSGRELTVTELELLDEEG